MAAKAEPYLVQFVRNEGACMAGVVRAQRIKVLTPQTWRTVSLDHRAWLANRLGYYGYNYLRGPQFKKVLTHWKRHLKHRKSQLQTNIRSWEAAGMHSSAVNVKQSLTPILAELRRLSHTAPSRAVAQGRSRSAAQGRGTRKRGSSLRKGSQRGRRRGLARNR